MKHKALTAAIAAALAAPMAAQAVDFSISGQVNRALFIVDYRRRGHTGQSCQQHRQLYPGSRHG